MKNNRTWLSISLFCCKSEWNRLFANGVIPFITANDLLEAYTIEFNYTGGENIRLSLLTNRTNINELTKKAGEHFKAWFLKASPVTTEVSLSEEEDALFPANPVQFGLYPALEIVTEEKENYSLSISLSQIILGALKEEVIDDETILTFAFYLTMCLIKVISSIHPGFINSLKPVFQPSAPSQAGNEVTAMEPEEIEAVNALIMDRITLNQKFEEYKAGLIEITGDVMNSVNETDMLGWLKQWLNTCKTELNKPGENGDIITTYKRIIETVYRNLGITAETNSQLYYFVQRVLGLMNPADIIIMGVQKCGTSTLHYTLTAHSNISGPVEPGNNKPVKEVNFFGFIPNWKKGMDWYFSHFVGSKGLFLDSSPNYITAPLYYGRLKMIMPDAKLIICLRDPVKRAYSHYNHYKQILPESEKWDWKYDQDFLTNIKTDLLSIQNYLDNGHSDLDSVTPFAGLVLRGVYISQIKQLLAYYDRSQIYITISDRWPQNYQSELDNIQAFLGLEKETLPPRIANKREYEEPINEEAKQLLIEFYKPYNQELFEFLGYEIPEWN